MEKIDINYSNKNIPVLSKYQYKIQLISKGEKVIRRMRWKSLEFLDKLSSNVTKEIYGFKLLISPPAVEQMADFEFDLMNMIKSLEFRKVNNGFQEELKSDIGQIKNDNKIFVSADKSRNTYMLQQKEYTKLLKENVTKTYKKSTRKKLFNISRNSKEITEKLPISDRIDKMQETEAYITIKDHKEDFPNKISCRLINPSKSSIGKISKVILDKINHIVQSKTSLNQWKNTSSLIEWFINIKNKESLSFKVCF